MDGRFVSGHQHGFKRGQSGNPGGRQSRLDTLLSHAYRSALAKDVNGETFAQAVAASIIEQAKKGNVQAATEIRKATEGDKINVNLTDALKLSAHQLGLDASTINSDPVLAAIFAAAGVDFAGNTANASAGGSESGADQAETATD